MKAIKAAITNHAPWTKVSGFEKLSPVSIPDEIRELVAHADIVVDMTGSEALTYSLAVVADSGNKPLASGALYRGGFIGRVQRQALSVDTPIHQREDESRRPLISARDETEEFSIPQLRCSAPVNNAPPSAVLACASVIVQVAADALTGRYEFPDEVIDVCRSIAEWHFDSIGGVSVAA